MSLTWSDWWPASLWLPFFLVLVLAVLSDFRERRVSNRLTGILLLVGVVASMARFGWLDGLSHAAGGAGLGLAIWLPMYALRLMGAGDVKLFAAGSAWLGWQASLIAAFATGLLGGVLGLLWLWHRQGFTAVWIALTQAFRSPTSLQLRELDRRERVPYALAIAGGLACGWWWTVLPALRR